MLRPGNTAQETQSRVSAAFECQGAGDYDSLIFACKGCLAMKSTFLPWALAMAFVPGVLQAQDWAGLYAGLSAAPVDGTYRHYDSGVISPPNTSPIDGELKGAFVGYNMQSGNLVYGGELAYSSGDLRLNGSTIYFIRDSLDVRGRVGYSLGRALVYGTVGWTTADQHWDDGAVTNSPVRVDGLSLGLGIDVQATDRVFFGLAYQRVTLVAEEGEIGGFPLVETNSDLEQVSLRVGFRF